MRPVCVELASAFVYPAHPIEFTLLRLDCPALIQFRLTKRDFCLPIVLPSLPIDLLVWGRGNFQRITRKHISIFHMGNAARRTNLWYPPKVAKNQNSKQQQQQ